jgi:hypothetical protein
VTDFLELHVATDEEDVLLAIRRDRILGLQSHPDGGTKLFTAIGALGQSVVVRESYSRVRELMAESKTSEPKT